MIRSLKVILVVMVLIVPSYIFAKTGFVTKTEKLEKQITELEKQISRVNIESKKVKKITERFKIIALDNKEVVVAYLEQKSTCLNLENKYKLKREHKKLSSRVINYQNSNVNDCYKRLNAINLSYDDMNEEFENLQTDIAELKDVIEAAGVTTDVYLKQLRLLRALVKHNNSLKGLSRGDVKVILDEITSKE